MLTEYLLAGAVGMGFWKRRNLRDNIVVILKLLSPDFVGESPGANDRCSRQDSGLGENKVYVLLEHPRFPYWVTGEWAAADLGVSHRGMMKDWESLHSTEKALQDE